MRKINKLKKLNLYKKRGLCNLVKLNIIKNNLNYIWKN